jgi:hypothetical protein
MQLNLQTTLNAVYAMHLNSSANVHIFPLCGAAFIYHQPAHIHHERRNPLL